jgi:hypothetical protein
LLRARENLVRAEAKEAELAITLATAQESKRLAALALASKVGVIPHDKPAEQKDGDTLFSLSWDEDFLAKIDTLEAEASEKEVLRELEGDLKAARAQLNEEFRGGLLAHSREGAAAADRDQVHEEEKGS